MVEQIQEHIRELKQYDRQRVFWLRLSGFVAIAILVAISDWNYIISNEYTWGWITLGLILSVVWWYWTMMLIRKLLHHREVESHILLQITKDIQKIKNEVKNNFNDSL